MYGAEVIGVHNEFDAGIYEEVVLRLLQQKNAADTIYRKYLGSWLIEKIKDFLEDDISEMELRCYANQFSEALGLIRLSLLKYAKSIGVIRLQMVDGSRDECYLGPIRFCLIALGFKVIDDKYEDPFDEVADNIKPDLIIYATRLSLNADYMHQMELGFNRSEDVVILTDLQSDPSSHEFSLKDLLFHTMQLAIKIRMRKFSLLHSWCHEDKVEKIIENAYRDIQYRLNNLYSLSYNHIFFDEFVIPLIETELRCTNGKEQIELLGDGTDWFLALDQYMMDHGGLSARQYDPVDNWPFSKVLKRYHKKK